MELRAGVLELRAGVLELRAGVLELRTGLLELRTGLLELGTGLLELRAGLLRLRTGLLELRAGMLELRTGLFEGRWIRVKGPTLSHPRLQYIVVYFGSNVKCSVNTKVLKKSFHISQYQRAVEVSTLKILHTPHTSGGLCEK